MTGLYDSMQFIPVYGRTLHCLNHVSTGFFMKKIALVFAFMLMSAASYASLNRMDDSSMAQKDQLTRSGDFGVLIFTTPDEKKARSEWAKRTDFVKLNGSKTVKRGTRVYVMFIFTGAKPDEAGKCRVTAKTQVIKPDGSVYEKIPPIKLWHDKPAPPHGGLELGDATIGLIIEHQDLLGKYIVKTVVTDNVSESQVTLETDFEAVP